MTQWFECKNCRGVGGECSLCQGVGQLPEGHKSLKTEEALEALFVANREWMKTL